MGFSFEEKAWKGMEVLGKAEVSGQGAPGHRSQSKQALAL